MELLPYNCEIDLDISCQHFVRANASLFSFKVKSFNFMEIFACNAHHSMEWCNLIGWELGVTRFPHFFSIFVNTSV